MSRVRVGGPSLPPAELPAPAEAVPFSARGMGVQAVSDTLVRVSGIPDVMFITAPRLHLEVDGQELTVMLSANMSPEQVRDEISAAVSQLNPLLAMPPPGSGIPMPDVPQYEVFSQRLPDGQLLVGVTHGSKDLERIAQKFDAATHTKSGRPSLVSRREIRDLFTVAQGNGMFSDEEKMQVAKGWADLFTGAGFQATKAAQEYFAKASREFNLPELPVY